MDDSGALWEANAPKDYEAERSSTTGCVTFRNSGVLQPEQPFPADPARAGWEKLE